MGQPLCFSSRLFVWAHVCVCVCVCVFNHTPECVLCQCRQWVGVFVVFMCGYCVWTERSLYSRHVVYSVLSDSLLPASVVYLCRLWEVWLTPHDWPTRNWPDLTGSDHTSRNKPGTTGRNQDAGSNHPHRQVKTRQNKTFFFFFFHREIKFFWPCCVLTADLRGSPSRQLQVTDESQTVVTCHLWHHAQGGKLELPRWRYAADPLQLSPPLHHGWGPSCWHDF